ncbi:MAG: cell division protein FtsQ/DivIB [Hyphomicrobium sp.]
MLSALSALGSRHDRGSDEPAGADRQPKSAGSRRSPTLSETSRKSLAFLVAALLGASGFLLLTDGGRRVRSESALLPKLERLAVVVGLGIDEVVLEGHAFTADGAVYDAIDLDNSRTFLTLDTAAVRTRIERLPWVATADITRVYPGRLAIRIRERKPFAVWRRGEEEQLVDRGGRVLALLRPGSIRDLPLVIGEGANTEAAGLLSLLDRFTDLKSRLTAVERIAERRWTLHLAGDITIHLPTDRVVPALEQLASCRCLTTALTVPGTTTDLRAENRIAIRNEPRKRTAAAVPGPRS